MSNAGFAERVERAKQGDEEAIRGLLAEFEVDVRQAVRRRLPRALRTQFDSMDFVQAVWSSFFAAGPGAEAEPVPQFDSPEHLRGYLAGVARNKVLQEFRRRTRTKKYDLGREEPLYVRRGGRDEPRELPAADPSPSADLQARDRLEQIVGGRPPIEAEVVELRREGLTFDEIAARTGLHERAARRVIHALRRRLEERRWL